MINSLSNVLSSYKPPNVVVSSTLSDTPIKKTCLMHLQDIPEGSTPILGSYKGQPIGDPGKSYFEWCPAPGSTTDEPKLLIRGHQNGQYFEEIININDVDPNNASHLELMAYQVSRPDEYTFDQIFHTFETGEKGNGMYTPKSNGSVRSEPVETTDFRKDDDENPVDKAKNDLLDETVKILDKSENEVLLEKLQAQWEQQDMISKHRLDMDIQRDFLNETLSRSALLGAVT